MAFDYNKAAGLGTSTIDRGVLGMPFINIIQKGSPEFDETHRKHADKKIEGCRPGNILFEIERAILPQPVKVIPLATTTLYTEWKPNGGGLVGNRTLDIINARDYRKGAPGSPQQYREYLGENELVYTIYFMVLFQHGEKWKQGLIAFTSTQLKVARNWSRSILATKVPGLAESVQPPIFAAVYKLTTFADSNAKGGFFSWQVEKDRLLDPVADQALMEQAFGEAQKAQLALPSARQAAAALPAAPVPATVGGEDEPF